MRKIIPFVITTIHDPGTTGRRGAVANLEELVSIANESPTTIFKIVEERYSALVNKLKKISSKGKLSKDDWAKIGELVTEFNDDMKNYAENFGLEVINLRQALAEDLGKSVNSIEAYLIYSKVKRAKQNLPEGKPVEVIIRCLNTTNRPMTPRQISAASGVNYNTVRRVVRELLRDGKIVRTAGKGTYTIK